MAAPVYFAQGGGPASAIAPIPGKVLVRFRDDKGPSDFGPRNQLVEAQEWTYLRPFRSFLVAGADTPRRRENASVQSGEPSAAFETQAQLSALPEVAVVELDWLILYSLMLTPNDTYWPKQWGMKKIKMSTAWQIQTGAAGLIIGLPAELPRIERGPRHVPPDRRASRSGRPLAGSGTRPFSPLTMPASGARAS